MHQRVIIAMALACNPADHRRRTHHGPGRDCPGSDLEGHRYVPKGDEHRHDLHFPRSCRGGGRVHPYRRHACRQPGRVRPPAGGVGVPGPPLYPDAGGSSCSPCRISRQTCPAWSAAVSSQNRSCPTDVRCIACVSNATAACRREQAEWVSLTATHRVRCPHAGEQG